MSNEFVKNGHQPTHFEDFVYICMSPTPPHPLHHHHSPSNKHILGVHKPSLLTQGAKNLCFQFLPHILFTSCGISLKPKVLDAQRSMSTVTLYKFNNNSTVTLYKFTNNHTTQLQSPPTFGHQIWVRNSSMLLQRPSVLYR